MLDAETWLTAEQCIEYGLADEYAEKDADLTETKKMLAKQMQNGKAMKNIKLPQEPEVEIEEEVEQEVEQATEQEVEQKQISQKSETAVKLMAAFINSFKN